MHIESLMLVLYLAAWIFGGLILLRDARSQPGIVRTMAFLAVILGPVAMMIYIGIRYLGQILQTHLMLSRDRTRELP